MTAKNNNNNDAEEEPTVKLQIDLRKAIVAVIAKEIPSMPVRRANAIASAAVKFVQVGLKVSSGEYFKK